MKAKRRTAAEQAESRIVFDKPCDLLCCDLTAHTWEVQEHLHGGINKAVSTGGQNPSGSAHTVRLIFRFRYHAAFADIRENPQRYRIRYGDALYEIADYDDYNERHTVIKLTGERIRTGTVTLISQAAGTDAIGQQISTETEIPLPCTEYEITLNEQAEVYQAGFRLACRLRIFRAEFGGEPCVLYGGKRYAVVSVRYVGDCADLYIGEKVGELRE